jgi:hypothetical protein
LEAGACIFSFLHWLNTNFNLSVNHDFANTWNSTSVMVVCNVLSVDQQDLYRDAQIQIWGCRIILTMFGRVKSKRENDIITGMALGRHRPKQPTTTLDRNLLAGIIPNKWRSIPTPLLPCSPFL